MMKNHSLKADRDRLWSLGGFIGVFISIIAIFFVIPIVMTSYYAHIALQASFTFLLGFTISMLTKEKAWKVIGWILMAAFLALDGISILSNSVEWQVAAYSVYCIFLVLAICFLSQKMLKMPFINTNLIFGVITIYLLAGILWGKMYFLVDAFFPHSFKGIQSISLSTSGLGDGYENQFNLMYFSFSTLTTLGLGDIVPLRHLAKSLMMLEAVFGQLFIAVVVAKVVTAWKKT